MNYLNNRIKNNDYYVSNDGSMIFVTFKNVDCEPIDYGDCVIIMIQDNLWLMASPSEIDESDYIRIFNERNGKKQGLVAPFDSRYIKNFGIFKGNVLSEII